MIPVIQEDVAKVNIIVGSCRSVDDDSTKDAVPGLDVEMRVIPAGTILNSPPAIGMLVTGGDRALSETGDTVILVRVVLADSMEVDASAVVLQRVCNVDNCGNWLTIGISGEM